MSTGDELEARDEVLDEDSWDPWATDEESEAMVVIDLERYTRTRQELLDLAAKRPDPDMPEAA